MVAHVTMNGSINDTDKKKIITVTQIYSDDETGEEMPSLVDQTFDDITQDPQDFIKEDEDVEKNEDEVDTDADDNSESDENSHAEVDSEDPYVDEFDGNDRNVSSYLADEPECRRPSIKKVSWFEHLKAFLGF